MNLSKIIFKKRYELLDLIELRRNLCRNIVQCSVTGKYNLSLELYKNVSGLYIQTSISSFLKKPIFVVTKDNFNYDRFFLDFETNEIDNYIGLIKQLNNELLEIDIPYIKKYKREQKLKKIIYEK